MNILNFGGGEIWDAIRLELIKEYPEAKITRSSCDVRNWTHVLAHIQINNPDWIIYTAGVSHIQHFAQGSENPYNFDKIKQEFEVNVLGAFYVAEFMKQEGINNFIALVSVAGLYGKPNHSGYSASKMALRSLIQSMAMEGLNAYGISPGRVDTAMRRKDYPNDPAGTCLSVNQVAKVVKEIMDGKYEPGDNVIIRKRGLRTLRRVDEGKPWREYLNVQPL